MTDKKIFLVPVENEDCLSPEDWKKRVELTLKLEEKITKEIIKEVWKHGIREEFSDEEIISLIFQKLKEELE